MGLGGGEQVGQFGGALLGLGGEGGAEQVGAVWLVHKSQGMTIKKVILDPGEKERHIGVLFTGLSRAPGFESVALANPMDMARLNSVLKSKAVMRRRLWEEQRWREPSRAVQTVLRDAVVGASGQPTVATDACSLSTELAKLRRFV